MIGSSQVLIYPYRPKWYMMALATLFFTACAFGLSLVAIGNDKGLVINHLIHLGPIGATLFYWVLVIASLGFVVFGLLGIRTAMTSQESLTIDSDSVSFPRGVSSRELTRLKFSEIAVVRLVKVSGQEMLELTPYEGRKQTIVRSWLPNKDAFDEVILAVDSAMKRQLS